MTEGRKPSWLEQAGIEQKNLKTGIDKRTGGWYILVSETDLVYIENGLVRSKRRDQRGGKMPATIRDLASRVGLSMSAVSKALNGYPDVSEKTRQMVLRAAQEMNYIPNVHARALKSGRNYSLGVLFTDGRRSGLTHPFFSMVLEGFRKETEEKGYDITFIGHRLGESGITYLEHCRSRELEGVCIACIDFSLQEVRELVEAELPVVTIDHPFPGRGCVLADNAGGMTSLVDYAAGLGHRRIALIHGDGGSVVTETRVSAFLSAMKARGLVVPPEYITSCEYTNQESGYEATERLLSLPEPPGCILASDDLSATGAMTAALLRGLRVPEDLCLAGYDGIEIMQKSHPRLTTVDQNAALIGRTAAELLMAQIEGAPPETRTVPSTLIPGETVGPPAGGA